MSGPYRLQAPKPAPGCRHVWEASPVWAWDTWTVLHYSRRCRFCRAEPPFWRRQWFSILDELRRLGLYDRLHQKLGEGVERAGYVSFHTDDPSSFKVDGRPASFKDHIE